MTCHFARMLEEYRQGLESEIQLLDALATLAVSQGGAILAHDADRLEAVNAEREQVVHDLNQLERRIRPLRAQLALHASTIQELGGFAAVHELHRRAEQQLDAVLSHDRQTGAMLERESEPRRLIAQELETGEATLAAYRKVLSPVTPRSGIFDRRG